MPTTMTQAERHVAIATPLGDDKLLLRAFTVSEQLGRPFQIDVELRSDDQAVKFDDLLGHNVTLRIDLADRKTRYFNGYVNRVSQVAAQGGLAVYHATVVPWLWFLTRAADCRIFQGKTVPDILKQVFRDRGFVDFEERLSGSYQTWEYCVQYRETDFNFVSRLMEQEGIYYYFKHENGKHTLVLTDSPSGHEPYPGYSTVAYRPPAEGDSGAEDFSHFSVGKEVQPGKFVVNDFDFKKPRKSLLGSATVTRKHPNGEFEVYDFPGEYDEFSEGSEYAKVRLQELAAQHELAQGRGDVRGVAAGFKFKLDPAPRKDFSKTYLVVSATCTATNDEFTSGAGASGVDFSNSFTAIDASVQYRAPRLTPKPVIQGPQTAIVVGKKGEEIWTDEYGRVKVQFHWDRYGKADENSSCWVRVAQVWAGKKWGAIYTPRVGQEVIVEFLEGDPDQPIITGRVYNGDCMPPYDPRNKGTVSTIKSLSSKGGGGFNEIRIEDKKGSEQLFFHAEKDHDVRVKNDTKEFVGKHRHLIVKGDQLERVNGDKHLGVKGDRNEKVDGTVSQKVGMDLQQKVGMKHALDAGMEVHIKAGMNVVIEAGMSVTLKAGGGFVVVGPAGVAISGTPILINSGGAPGSGSGASPEPPKPPTEADKAEAGQKEEAKAASRPPKPTKFSPAAIVLKQAAKSGTPFCEKCQGA
jgi:type VI secretion system secreted protein VgrG